MDFKIKGIIDLRRWKKKKKFKLLYHKLKIKGTQRKKEEE